MGMDHYKVIKQLGGTNGASLAIDKQDGSKKVVIKRLLDGLKGMEELNVSLRVRHPNIIPFLESFVYDGALYVVLLYAEGGDLEAYLESLAKKNNLPSSMQLLKWFRQIISALQCCHEQNIIHRDVKPGNIFLNSTASELYLGDFGSAKALLKNISMTSTFVGSPIWISPELLTGAAYSYPSDIWSLGCVLYEMATLKHPFTSSSFALLVQQITSGEFNPLPSTVPEDIRAIILSMLKVNPKQRASLSKALEMVDRAIATRVASEKATPPMYLPKRAMDAAAAQRPRSGESPQPPLPSDGAADEARLSLWIHAREHDVDIIERYLNKFRQADDEVLEAPRETPTRTSTGQKSPPPHGRQSQQVQLSQRGMQASPQKRTSAATAQKNMERVSPQKVRMEPVPQQQQQQQQNNNNNQQNHLVVVPMVRARASIAPCDVRLMVPQQIQPQQQARQNNRRRVVVFQKSQQQQQQQQQQKSQHPQQQQQQRQRVHGHRKSDASTSGSSAYGNVQRLASPLAREPSSSHHLACSRTKSTPSAARRVSPIQLAPQQEEERQQLREKRDQERAKMMEMIREQKAKALLKRKAGGKSETRSDALAIEIVLPDNVRYVESA